MTTVELLHICLCFVSLSLDLNLGFAFGACADLGGGTLRREALRRKLPGDGDEEGGFDNFPFHVLVFLLFLPQVFIAVVHKCIQLDKSLVANLAVVGPLSFFQAHAQPDVGGAHKCATADPTLQILGAALRLLGLAEQRGRGGFGLPGGLLGFVREQQRQGVKRQAALLALVYLLLSVQADMRQKPGLLGEGLATEGAFKGFLASVEPAVRL